MKVEIRPVPQPAREVVLTLTEIEAGYLKTLTGSCDIGCADRLFGNLWKALSGIKAIGTVVTRHDGDFSIIDVRI